MKERHLEFCPFCLPTEHYVATAERGAVMICAFRAGGPLRKGGPRVVAAAHRPGCVRGLWCPTCGVQLVAGLNFGIYMCACVACSSKDEEDEAAAEEARLAREREAARRRQAEQGRALANVLRKRLRAVGADAYLGHVDGEGGLLALAYAFNSLMAGRLEPSPDPEVAAQRAADRRALWEALRAVTDLALHRAQPAQTEH